MTVMHIAPDCCAEVEFIIRQDAKARGIQVMPARPFPWNRVAVRALEKAAKKA